MSKPKILVQLDPSPQASVFDSVVAVDSEVDQLFRQNQVGLEDVESIVHGAIFTRGPTDLQNTAIFIGGQDISFGEVILAKVKETFFGPMSVSVMLDSNGSNTTAVAAVLCAEKHRELSDATVTVLAGTGPVGQRIIRLAARAGATVCVGSRRLSKSELLCQQLTEQHPDWKLRPFGTEKSDWPDQIAETEILFGAGAAGCELISPGQLDGLKNKTVLIDLNAVPPAGIPGVDVMAAGTEQSGIVHYGAIGVGGLKMKIHKACLRKLFTANNLCLDAEEIYELGKSLISN